MSARPPLRRLPGVPRVLLHEAGGRRARLTRALTGASDRRRGFVDALAFIPVALAGPAWLPTADPWRWPTCGPDELQSALRAHFPALVILGAVLPRQADRERLSLLCHASGNPLVVKLGSDDTVFRAEHRALELLVADPLPGIATPRPHGFGILAVNGGSPDGPPVFFVATSAVGLRAQRPAIGAPLRTFESDLGKRLGSLPAPDGGTSGLVPVHGDLTPWNLRRTRRGLALFDWEAAGWGAPGSDVANYRRTSQELRSWGRRGGGTA